VPGYRSSSSTGPSRLPRNLPRPWAVRALQLDQFRESPTELGALVLAAGGGEPVLDAQALTKIADAAGARAPLLLDFGVPPNADPEATRLAGIARVGMDDLIQAAQERRLSQLMRLAPVRAAIDERLTRLRGELATRAIGRRLADLRGTFEQIAAEEAERALADELSDLDAGQRELLQRFASTVCAPVGAFASRRVACRGGTCEYRRGGRIFPRGAAAAAGQRRGHCA